MKSKVFEDLKRAFWIYSLYLYENLKDNGR